MNRFALLKQFGQSIWYDGIGRDLIQSGAIKDWIETDGLSGVTSNPTTFEKAISTGEAYHPYLKEIASQPIGIKEIYEAIAIRDIQDTADILLPVYEKTDAKDGYVSMELSPDLAFNAKGTVEEALRLFKRIDRRNLMIKVPGTEEVLPAIERLITEGVNINVTLLFSVTQYQDVALAYLAGLQRRLDAGYDISTVASVASFFVSRIDTQIDRLLEAKQHETNDPAIREKYQPLLGKVAIANAKIAYIQFQEIIASRQFLHLRERGAMPQRLLWASTGTKNKNYADTCYVEALIGKDTINTVPAETFIAFSDHGNAENSLTRDTEDARKVMTRLAESGIDFQAVAEQLQIDGLLLFSNSFDQLLATLHKKRMQYVEPSHSRISMSLGRWGQWESKVFDCTMNLKHNRIPQRIWKKDPNVWRKNPPKEMPILLGWLNIIEQELETVTDLTAFAWEVAAAFKHVVLIGIGGSSLCPRVLREIFGQIPHFPTFDLLDTIVPTAILSLEQRISLEDTLFIVSSKSGSTIEPMTLTEYFLERLTMVKREWAGGHFVAITDPGSPFSEYAKQNLFCKIFYGVADIGGRYSALSHFGMVPAAAMGIRIGPLLKEAQKMRLLCDPHVPCEDNPSVRLGVAIGQLAKEGLDKLTFIASPTVSPFGFWLEQLIAESTGKERQGIIPIVEEALQTGGAVGRVYVYIRYAKDDNIERDKQVTALEHAGHPVIRIEMSDLMEIGGQFFLWAMATAVAGSILKVNPFDQPDVESSKKNTRALLEHFVAIDSVGATKVPSLPVAEQPLLTEDGITLYTNMAVEKKDSLKDVLCMLIESTGTDDYIAIDPYLEQTESIHKALQSIRALLGQKKNIATTLGYGPAYLHSSGQLQKGGPRKILALIISSEAIDDIQIPGKNYTFGTLAIAQAIGDYQSLCQNQHRVIRIHLGADIDAGLNTLIQFFRFSNSNQF